MPVFTTPYTQTTLLALVRNLLLERTNDVGLITDQEANDLINMAGRIIWMRIATKYPDVFAIRSASNITVTNGSTTFAAIATSSGVSGAQAGHVYRILNAQVGTVGAALEALDQINVFGKVADRHVYEHGNAGTGLFAPPALPYRYYVEGPIVYFSPITSGSFDARFQWIQQPRDMSAGSDTLWEGALPQFGEYVAILASSLAASKDGVVQTTMDKFMQYVDQVLVENFGPPYNPYDEAPKELRP